MTRRGTSLIDLLISIAIIAILFGGIYLVYFSLVTAIANISVRTAATSAIQAEMETIRNLPYASVGTVGGVPAGIIPQSQVVAVGQYTFALNTTIRNIDDPFDGTLNGTPQDTSPLDYKEVAVQATCPFCSNYVAVTVTTTVAPKNLESAPTNGSLFLYAVDANGNPVSGATMQVTNASVTPSINLTDTTNASGVLELVGVPTSTEDYHIVATKAGYSTDQTYPPGAPANPNPLKPDATVLAQSVTSVTFAIDRVSTVSVVSSDNRCAPVASVPFAMQGAKLIGTNPSVFKLATTSATGAGGTITMSNVEWDSYTFALNGGVNDLAGTIPLNPLIVNPNTSSTFRLVVQPAADPSLLVTVLDTATGAGIPGADVTLTKSGFSASLTTNHAFIMQSDWSGGQYSSQSGGVSAAGELTLLANASGTYNTNTNDWLASNTFDLGGQNSTLYGLSWSPASEPAGTSAEFQLAANNDDATWNYVGPDGTAGSYFTVSSSSIPASLSGNRYLRYKVFLNTNVTSTSPSVSYVSIEFTADCVPPAQALFTNLAQGAFTADVTAPNYYEASTTVAVGAGATSTTVYLNHQ
jgi:hypothetical protein